MCDLILLAKGSTHNQTKPAIGFEVCDKMAALKVGFPKLMVGQWKGWDSHRNSRDDKKSAKRICHPAVDPLLNCALPYNCIAHKNRISCFDTF